MLLEDISKKIHRLLKESCKSCKSDIIALSGGLDSSIIAYMLKERKPKGIAIIAQDFVANDLTYCQMVSKYLGIPLIIYNVDMSEILNGIEETIKILKNFNDIEIRNNVVMYLAIKWAKDHGHKSIITGDGADELFSGYSFLINKTEEEIEKENQRIYSIMHFPTQEIGKHIGIKVESPFLNKEMIEFAKDIPAKYKVREENRRRHGKWILRKTFEENIPKQIAWREKSPMQDGSGTAELTNLFDSIINDEKFEEKKKNIKKSDGIIIRTKESMYYYKIFKKFYGIPVSSAENACPFCKHNVNNSKFCRMCGAFPI